MCVQLGLLPRPREHRARLIFVHCAARPPCGVAGLKCGSAVDLLSPAIRMQAANTRILSQFRCLAETVTGNTNKEILRAIPRPAGRGRARYPCALRVCVSMHSKKLALAREVRVALSSPHVHSTSAGAPACNDTHSLLPPPFSINHIAPLSLHCFLVHGLGYPSIR